MRIGSTGKVNRPPSRRLATTDLEQDDTAEIDEPENGPLRRCVVTRERLPKERMIRFVLDPDRRLIPDLAARLPGRGMWLSASWDVLNSHAAGRSQTSVGKPVADGGAGGLVASSTSVVGSGFGTGGDRLLARAFARAARGPVTVPPDLADILRSGLVQRIAALLGLARRAGQAVAGFEKAREMLRAGKARLVIQAADGSAAERARFLSGLETVLGAAPKVIDPIPGADLGRVFGRDYVVHVAVAPGKLADQLVMESGRLAGLTNGSTGTTRRSDASMNDVAGTDENT